MDFLPMPHHIAYGEGVFRIGIDTKIVLEGTEPSALLYAKLLQEAAADFTGLQLEILKGAVRPGDIVLTVNNSLPESSYTLSVKPEGVTVTGAGDEALLNGVMTLRQWMQRHGALLPALEIEDAPDLAHRGYYLDCSRGRVPTLAMLKRYADLLCQYKINEWQLYIEHTYLFRDLSEAWREDTPLTAEEIMELDAYCAARHIELVPSLSSFGHMYQILSTKTCAALCELPDSEKIPFSYTYWGEHHTVNVSNPDAMPFIKRLIGEYMPLFRSKKFNICCDETFDLGKGRSKPLADAEGAQTLYVRHVAELCRWLLDQGVTPMFWGDIMWRHPETYADIPEGTVCLNWGYLPNQRENEIRDLAAMGAVQYACPGVCTWNRWIPLFENSYNNIRNMCRHAHKYGAIGLLNTDWGDYAHICHPFLSLPGILYGAAFAWNASGAAWDEVNGAISFLAYGDRTGDFMRAMTALSDHEVFNWFHMVRWIEEKDAEKRRLILHDENEKDVAQHAPAAIAALEQGLQALDAAVPHMDKAMRPVVQALHIQARGAILCNEIGLYVAAHEDRQDVPHRQGPELAAALENWFRLYMNAWRAVSKESAVHRMRSVVCAWADYLRGRFA